MSETILFTILFVAALVFIVFLLMWMEKWLAMRRRKTLLPKAIELGFTEFPLEKFDIKKLYPPFLLMGGVHLIHDLVLHRELGDQKLQHILSIEINSGQGQTERMTVSIFHFPEMNLPKFLLKGKDKTRFTMRFLHDLKRFGQTLIHSYHGVDIQASEKFHQNYKVLSPHGASEEVKKIFTPDLVRYFESHPGWQVEGIEDWLLFYRRSVVIKPVKFAQFAQESHHIASGFLQQTLPE